MEEKNNGGVEKSGRAKQILLAAAAGMAAVVLFLAAYYIITGTGKNVYYDGAGEYCAFMSSTDGIASESSGLEIELLSNGECAVKLNGKSRKGKWSRTDNIIRLTVGGEKFSGTISENAIELTRDSDTTSIALRKSDHAADEKPIPSGRWMLAQLTDVFSVYTKDALEQTGYGNSYLIIDADGRGSADILGQGEAEISADGEYIHYNGQMLKYTFSDKALIVKYSDGVTLDFEKTE